MSDSEAPGAATVLDEHRQQRVKNTKFFKNARARLHTRVKHLQDAAEALYHEDSPGDLVVMGRRAEDLKWSIDYIAGHNAAQPAVAKSIRRFIQEALSGCHDATWTAGRDAIFLIPDQVLA